MKRRVGVEIPPNLTKTNRAPSLLYARAELRGMGKSVLRK
nr:MAG TPA: hypothetical protein [Caudoviricetes sp.]